MSARLAETSSAGAVGPRAARTGSPGMRWIMRNDAVTSTHKDTSRRPRRRTPNRTHGWVLTPTRGVGGATELARDIDYFATIRMLVGMNVPGYSNSAPLPNVFTTLLANGTMS